VSDRDQDRTGELPPSEPVAPTGTEPIRPPVVPTRRRTGGGTGIPGSLLVIAAVILVAGLLLGFLIGRATGPDEPSEDAAVEQSGGGGGGGGGEGGGGGGGGAGQGQRGQRRACREALSLSQQVTAVQNQLLTNRGELIRAVVAEDAEQIEQLNAQSDQLIQQMQSLQEDLDRQTRRCL
jgi:uncharacterized protein HemX